MVTFRRAAMKKNFAINRLMLIVTPLVVFLAAEGGLRVAGFGGFPPLFLERATLGNRRLMETNPEAGQSYFMANRIGRGANRPEIFMNPKEPGAVRIILAGESAAMGFPQPPPLTAGRFLQVMLQDLWPDRKVEVINLGTTAVASFPVADMAGQALAIQPDLVVIYAGNNEFYGAFGVASAHFAGSSPRLLPVLRWGHGLALVQWVQARMRRAAAPASPINTMEAMVREARIDPSSGLRAQAARQIHRHFGRLIDRARAAGVPVLICTAPVQELDLAPFGSTTSDERVKAGTGDPERADYHYDRARASWAMGHKVEALADFQQAIDLDTMPWRATSDIQETLLELAQRDGARLCDLREAFRQNSVGGVVGWDLMDDHVHPSLRGQVLVARTVLESLARLPGRLHVTPEQLAQLPDWIHYAHRQGQNPYEDYARVMGLISLFSSGFMQASNPQARDRLQQEADRLAEAMPPVLARALAQAVHQRLYQGQSFSASAVAGALFYAWGDYAEAAKLLAVARDSLPPYSSDCREVAYFLLASRQNLQGALNPDDQALAREEIERGLLLLRFGVSSSGKTHRYLGGLYGLVGDSIRAAEYHRQADAKGAPPLPPLRNTVAPQRSR
jgi:lysophospholipase L1-like esterase